MARRGRISGGGSSWLWVHSPRWRHCPEHDAAGSPRVSSGGPPPSLGLAWSTGPKAAGLGSDSSQHRGPGGPGELGGQQLARGIPSPAAQARFPEPGSKGGRTLTGHIPPGLSGGPPALYPTTQRGGALPLAGQAPRPQRGRRGAQRQRPQGWALCPAFQDRGRVAGVNRSATRSVTLGTSPAREGRGPRMPGFSRPSAARGGQGPRTPGFAGATLPRSPGATPMCSAAPAATEGEASLQHRATYVTCHHAIQEDGGGAAATRCHCPPPMR